MKPPSQHLNQQIIDLLTRLPYCKASSRLVDRLLIKNEGAR